MYLQKIHIENYRLLTNIDIFLDRVLTLIVGKNNTGKTSVINLIRKVLNEEKTLSIDDYPLECRSRLYDVIEKYWAGEIDQSEVKQQIAETSISFYIDYSEEDDDQPLGSLSPFIIDIDDNNTSARIDAIYTFDELKADEMFSSCKGRYDQLLQARQKDNPGDEGQEGFDRALTAAVVKDSFDKFFYLKVLAVNPSNVEDCQEKPSSLLRKLFTYRTIEAERNLDESENKNDHPLAGMMNRVFNPEEQELESAFSPIISELNRYVDDVGFSAQERIDALMNQIIAGMIHFGYPSAEDLKLKASSNISLKNQIMSNTDLMYTSSDGGESLPSTHNGLGYKNLIKISLILTEFSRAVVANATTIPLLLIEEPEAHMDSISVLTSIEEQYNNSWLRIIVALDALGFYKDMICNIPNFGKTIHRCRKYCYMKYRNYLEEMMCALQMLEAKFGDVLEKYPPFSKEWEEEKRTAISILASIK